MRFFIFPGKRRHSSRGSLFFGVFPPKEELVVLGQSRHFAFFPQKEELVVLPGDRIFPKAVFSSKRRTSSSSRPHISKTHFFHQPEELVVLQDRIFPGRVFSTKRRTTSSSRPHSSGRVFSGRDLHLRHRCCPSAEASGHLLCEERFFCICMHSVTGGKQARRRFPFR